MDQRKLITVFLCGDVMTGRGIDQILPHPGAPVLHERYVKDARAYVDLAESVNGPIPKPVSHFYIWGDALHELDSLAPDFRIINLETSITTSDDYWRGKGINYRMHPRNVPCLAAAKIDLCVLANNHVLDWGYDGLIETLAVLNRTKMTIVGAGLSLKEAGAPAVLEIESKGRLIVFAWGTTSSGIPDDWAATENRPGVNLLRDFSKQTVHDIASKLKEIKQPGDIAIASIHWGGNWGYAIPPEHTKFAHSLIDQAGFDIIHGHSSHHVKGLEVYRDKPIIYGCGDFLNDYEGISGYEEFRADLGLMYFVTIAPPSGELVSLRMTPTQIRNFRVNRASGADALWSRDILNREGARLGTRVDLNEDNKLNLRWD